MGNCFRKSKIFKNGFTLAEVLITLVIVGVIAAMTIPNIIYETKKHEYSARLKKFYSTMKQASIRAEADGKSWNDWAKSQPHSSRGVAIASAFQDEYLLPYLSYYKTEIDEKLPDWRKVYLNDGSYFYNQKGDCLDFRFDVNGDKLPNLSGRDVFVFVYCPTDNTGWTITGTFIPYWQNQFNRSTALQNCKNSAAYCSALLMLDGWEFKSDYPYRL